MLGQFSVFPVLPTIDIARARKFYVDTLGLSEVDVPGASDDETLALSSGDAMMLVYYRPEATKATHTVAGWLVDDLDAAVADLRKRGVRLETYADMPGVTWDERGVATDESGRPGAWFKDPDGNILALAAMPV